MAIVNRDKDASEQLYVIQNAYGAVATGVSAWVGVVPSAGQILELKISGRGLSATPVYQLALHRWTTAGKTGIALGGGLTLTGAFGLSGGVIGTTYAAASSLAAVQAGDLLTINSSGADTAVTDLVVAVVLKATEDIKKSFDI